MTTKKKREIILNLAEKLQDEKLEKPIQSHIEECYDYLLDYAFKDMASNYTEDQLRDFKDLKFFYNETFLYKYCLALCNYKKDILSIYKMNESKNVEVVDFSTPASLSRLYENLQK